jgi:hypothetical protein
MCRRGRGKESTASANAGEQFEQAGMGAMWQTSTRRNCAQASQRTPPSMLVPTHLVCNARTVSVEDASRHERMSSMVISPIAVGAPCAGAGAHGTHGWPARTPSETYTTPLLIACV